MRTGCCATDANQQRSQHSARLGLQPGNKDGGSRSVPSNKVVVDRANEEEERNKPGKPNEGWEEDRVPT